MTHRIMRLVLLVAVAFIFTPAPMQAQSGARSTDLTGLDGFVEQVMKEWKVPGLAVAIVKDGKVLYAKGYGHRDVKKGLPVTTNTLFAIGSCTKAFTAAAMGILLDEKKLDWDKPARDYLPDLMLSDAYTTTHIRPRDLITHQSGLPRHDLVWYGAPLSRQQIYERLRYLEPSRPLHARYQYNNLMFMTAGLLVEKVSGNTWEDFVRRRILDPLGMKTSNFSVTASQQTSDFSFPYAEQKGEVKEIPFRNIDAIGPAGSINSSVNEMANWLVMQLGKGKFNGREIISEKSLTETHTPQIVAGGDLKYDESFYASYAMGWVVTSYRGHASLAHGGGIDGFTSTVRFLPKDQLGVVVLTNSGSPASGLIATNAIDRVLGLSEAPWFQRAKEDAVKGREAQAKSRAEDEAKRKKDTQPSHNLRDYAGRFEHPAYQTLIVTQESLTNPQGVPLKFDLHGLNGGLKHYHFDTFQVVDSASGLDGTKVTFVTNKAGEIESVSIAIESTVKDIVFTRKPVAPEKAASQD